jgi:hypothetical protein
MMHVQHVMRTKVSAAKSTDSDSSSEHSEPQKVAANKHLSPAFPPANWEPDNARTDETKTQTQTQTQAKVQSQTETQTQTQTETQTKAHTQVKVQKQTQTQAHVKVHPKAATSSLEKTLDSVMDEVETVPVQAAHEIIRVAEGKEKHWADIQHAVEKHVAKVRAEQSTPEAIAARREAVREAARGSMGDGLGGLVAEAFGGEKNEHAQKQIVHAKVVLSAMGVPHETEREKMLKERERQLKDKRDMTSLATRASVKNIPKDGKTVSVLVHMSCVKASLLVVWCSYRCDIFVGLWIREACA